MNTASLAAQLDKLDDSPLADSCGHSMVLGLAIGLALLAAAQKHGSSGPAPPPPAHDAASHCWPPSSCPPPPDGQGANAPANECNPTCECCLCVSEGASLAHCEKTGLDCRCFVGAGQPGPCDDLEARTAAVNDECCDEAAEHCVSGRPAVCNRACARQFLRFYEDCAFRLGPQGALFEPVVAMCEATERAAGEVFDGSQILDAASGVTIDNWVAHMGMTDVETVRMHSYLRARRPRLYRRRG